MFEMFLSIGYSRRTSNYLERIALSYLNHMMIMVNPMAFGVETQRIDSGFTELIHMNP